MNLIDRSPGGFIVAANAILYATVLAEIGMLVSGSIAAMIAFMILIVALAALLCQFIMGLMDDEPAPALSPARSTRSRDRAPRPARSPRPAHRAAHPSRPA